MQFRLKRKNRASNIDSLMTDETVCYDLSRMIQSFNIRGGEFSFFYRAEREPSVTFRVAAPLCSVAVAVTIHTAYSLLQVQTTPSPTSLSYLSSRPLCFASPPTSPHSFHYISITAIMSTLSTVQDLKIALLKDLPAVTDVHIEHCLTVVQQLSNCQVTLDILTETMIGKEVSKLKNHEHEPLKNAAKMLVKKWKRVAAAASGAAAAPASTTTKAKSKISISAAKIGKAERRGSSNSSDTNNAAPANPETEWMGLAPQRQNICKKFYSLLLAVQPELTKQGMHVDAVNHLMAPRAAEIETAMYDKFRNHVASSNAYTDKARTLSFNLKKNRDLCQRVVLGRVSATALIGMTSEQLAPVATQISREVEAKKLQDANRLDWDQANEDKINEMCGIKGDLLNASLFTCGRCKSIKTTSTQKQTRSADEPMTVFVLCLNCGKRWKC
jgi:transcription elongation factor S-II